MVETRDSCRRAARAAQSLNPSHSATVSGAKRGGERGIRTLGRVSPTHAFQACSLNHSDISPFEQTEESNAIGQVGEMGTGSSRPLLSGYFLLERDLAAAGLRVRPTVAIASSFSSSCSPDSLPSSASGLIMLAIWVS